jgi:hypothetical protein
MTFSLGAAAAAALGFRLAQDWHGLPRPASSVLSEAAGRWRCARDGRTFRQVSGYSGFTYQIH